MSFTMKQVLILILIMVINCCGRTNTSNEMKTWDGNVIVDTGKYYIRKNRYIVNVSKDDNLILNYSVVNEHGDKIIESVEHASVTHRWCIFWGKNNSLWVWSSDIGGFYWEKDSNGKYEQQKVNSTEHFDKMPIEVFSFLPSSLRKKLSEEGNVHESNGTLIKKGLCHVCRMK